MDQPPSTRFRERVRDSFERQNVMRTIGAELTNVDYGTVEIEMPHSNALTQQHGFLHAGILSTVLDSACGYAALSVMPEESAVLTIEFKINLLSPGRGERFLFRGEVTKPGSNIIRTLILRSPLTNAQDRLRDEESRFLLSLLLSNIDSSLRSE